MTQTDPHKKIPSGHKMTADMTFGAVVRSLRDKQGINQEELAGRVGSEQSWVSKLESDKIDPPLSKISAIADALGVSKSQLFGIAERTMAINKMVVIERDDQLINIHSDEITAYQEHIADLRRQVEDFRFILTNKYSA